MKGQFQSSEVLKLRFPPFIDVTTGLEITGDACTIVVRKPDNSTATYNSGSSPAVAYDSTIGLWTLDIPTGSYAQGEWKAKATSSGSNSNVQRKVVVWGDYVEKIDTALSTVNTAVAGVATAVAGVATSLSTVSSDVSAVSDDVSELATGVSAMTDSVSGLVDSVSDVATIVENLQKIAVGRWKVSGSTLTLYDDDNTSILYRFNLLDDDGEANGVRVFERVPNNP